MEIFFELLLPLFLFAYLMTGGFKRNKGKDLTIFDESKIKSKIGKFSKTPYLQKSYPEIIEKNVWEELIKLHKSKGWSYGVFETEKYVETVFPIEEDHPKHYFQMIYNDCLHFRIRIIEDFPVDVTTDLFILTTHFNNNLYHGILSVNVNNRGVDFTIKNELEFYSTFPDKIERDLSNHYYISKDIFWTFNKYLNERDDPAFVFAEFIERIKEKEGQN